MILIADSGSTKTAWRIIDQFNHIHQAGTQGFNPYFQDTSTISDNLKKELIPFLPDEQVDKIYFYGAGCSNIEKVKVIEKALLNVFPIAQVEVEHDLLAAARALCGSKPGIAAILGTGSNSCLYDGKNIVENVASLGYILGDEGSGAHLGKTFIQAYLNKELPAKLSENFYNRYKLTKDEVLEAIYKQPLPNRFLASFAKFIYQNINEPAINEMLIQCFEEFFDKHICKYKNDDSLKLSIVGSVGFYFSNIIRRVAQDKGIEIETILESPIAGLTLYHTQ